VTTILLVGSGKLGRRLLAELGPHPKLAVYLDHSNSPERVWRLLRRRAISPQALLRIAAAELWREAPPAVELPPIGTNSALLRAIRFHKAERVIMFHAGLIVRRAVLNAGVEILNVHCARIPEFGGLAAISRALAAGALQQEASLHLVTKEIDEGELVDSEPYTLDPRASFRVNEDGAYAAGVRLVLRNLGFEASGSFASSRTFCVGNALPRQLAAPLFGDRSRFGVVVDESDPHWVEWEEAHDRLQGAMRGGALGRSVSNAAYSAMQDVDLAGKRVLELGPGEGDHVPFWRSRPESYVLAGGEEVHLERARSRLAQAGVDSETVLMRRDPDPRLPFADDSFDVVVAFFCLELLLPLEAYIREIKRILRPGGRLVGAVQCAGGLAWGLGRALRSRRWLQRNTSVNPDKITCWEHAHFASRVLDTLDQRFRRAKISYWPLRVPSVDTNLVTRFVYENH
jgi:SAM-dependent methyltransferase